MSQRLLELNYGVAGIVADLTVEVVDNAGAPLIAQSGSGIADDGDGFYTKLESSWDDSWSGRVKWRFQGVVVATEQFAASAVDGIGWLSALSAMLAVLAGKTTVSGNTVSFKGRDGVTEKAAITYGTSTGQRSSSTVS